LIKVEPNNYLVITFAPLFLKVEEEEKIELLSSQLKAIIIIIRQ
jgi:hypothetical protein